MRVLEEKHVRDAVLENIRVQNHKDAIELHKLLMVSHMKQLLNEEASTLDWAIYRFTIYNLQGTNAFIFDKWAKEKLYIFVKGVSH